MLQKVPADEVEGRAVGELCGKSPRQLSFQIHIFSTVADESMIRRNTVKPRDGTILPWTTRPLTLSNDRPGGNACRPFSRVLMVPEKAEHSGRR